MRVHLRAVIRPAGSVRASKYGVDAGVRGFGRLELTTRRFRVGNWVFLSAPFDVPSIEIVF